MEFDSTKFNNIISIVIINFNQLIKCIYDNHILPKLLVYFFHMLPVEYLHLFWVKFRSMNISLEEWNNWPDVYCVFTVRAVLTVLIGATVLGKGHWMKDANGKT